MITGVKHDIDDYTTCLHGPNMSEAWKTAPVCFYGAL